MTAEPFTPSLAELSGYVAESPDGAFTVHRDLFTDPAVFEMEMRHIFESGWVFLAFDAQLPAPFDFYCVTLGRQPVILTRSQDSVVHGLLNSCRHKGARLATREAGSAPALVCPYHAWSYHLDGRLRFVKDAKHGAYADSFARQDLDLRPLARLESYRGMIFGSLNADVPPLEDYLGEAKPMIDLVMDQGPQGMELVPGRTRYIYQGNWKLQVENGMDPYHLTSTHSSFIDIIAERNRGRTDMASIGSRDFAQTVDAQAGAFAFDNGHGAVWIDNQTPAQKPLYAQWDALTARVGERRAEWMIRFRNLVLFPNVQLADSESLILRVIRPLAVDRTEMQMYSLAPIGEPAQARTQRIRQHEDFFNVSGLATPDDTTVYEEIQAGLGARVVGRQGGYDRGAAVLCDGPDAAALSLGCAPRQSLTGPFRIQAEIQYRPIYRQWIDLIRAGVARDALAHDALAHDALVHDAGAAS